MQQEPQIQSRIICGFGPIEDSTCGVESGAHRKVNNSDLDICIILIRGGVCCREFYIDRYVDDLWSR